MKPLLIVLVLLIYLRYVFGIVNLIIGVQLPCQSLIDCLSSPDENSVCYQGYCVPCRNSSESCSSSIHCCSGARCYRHRCTNLVTTGQTCRLNRECLDTNDFCINRRCTQCVPLWSPCSTDPLSTPCCTGIGICRFGICQPAFTQSERCSSSFECADELVCLQGRCQNPLEPC